MVRDWERRRGMRGGFGGMAWGHGMGGLWYIYVVIIVGVRMEDVVVCCCLLL